MTERKMKAMFAPGLGSKFQITSGEGEATEYELVEVEDLKPSSTNPKHNVRQDPFVLLFEGPDEGMVDQGLCTVKHPELGTHEIFLVRVAPGQYEAVFN